MKIPPILALVIAISIPWAHAQTQGVTKNEIVIGTIQDLSGPAASYGKWMRNGLQLRIDEVNEQGGIHGRKVKLIAEDSGYDPKRAVLAAQKLVNQDKVFLVAGHLGTAQNNAAMPVQFEKNVINFMPGTGAREMFEPLNKLKFAIFPTYFDTMRSQAPQLYKAKKAAKACILYQDDEYGLEVFRGTEAGLKDIGVELSEKTSYKRGATDFSSQVVRMKSANCDFVVLGTIVRETLGALGEAKKIGFTPTFLGSYASYTDLLHKLGGKTVDNYYAVSILKTPYLDEASQPIRFWANKYKTKFDADPSIWAEMGYVIADVFVRGAQKAGSNLTTEAFIKAVETLGPVNYDMFESPTYTWTATKRLGSGQARLSQIQDGRWRTVSEYPTSR
jgi:branched-chain amino acid transport system substrate-binding protein